MFPSVVPCRRQRGTWAARGMTSLGQWWPPAPDKGAWAWTEQSPGSALGLNTPSRRHRGWERSPVASTKGGGPGWGAQLALSFKDEPRDARMKTGRLKGQTLFSPSSGGWQVQDQSASRFGVWWGPCFWFTDDCLPTWQKEARNLSGVSFVRTLIPSWRHHLHELITSQSPPAV